MAVPSTKMIRVNDGASPWLCFTRNACSAIVVALLLFASIAPAFADDDEGPPPPPSAEAVAAAGRTTIAVLALVVGVAVFYGVQRHSLLNSSKHPPEWQTKMTRNAIVLALLSVVVVWGVCSALSRPPQKARIPAAGAVTHAP